MTSSSNEGVFLMHQKNKWLFCFNFLKLVVRFTKHIENLIVSGECIVFLSDKT